MFKIGDKVEVIGCRRGSCEEILTIEEVHRDDFSDREYRTNDGRWFARYELNKVEETISVSSDGIGLSYISSELGIDSCTTMYVTKQDLLDFIEEDRKKHQEKLKELGTPKFRRIKGEEEMTKLQLEHALNGEIRKLEVCIEHHLEGIENLDIEVKRLQERRKDQKTSIKGYESRIESIHNNLDKLNSNRFVFGRRSGNNFLDENGQEYFLLEDDTLITSSGLKYTYSIIDGMVLIFSEEKKGK